MRRSTGLRKISGLHIYLLEILDSVRYEGENNFADRVHEVLLR